jgi:hypothetical protein
MQFIKQNRNKEAKRRKAARNFTEEQIWKETFHRKQGGPKLYAPNL